MSNAMYLDLLRLAVPEAILVLTVLVLLAADFVALREMPLRLRSILSAVIAVAGCGFAAAWLLLIAPDGDAMEGMFVSDSLTRFLKVSLLGLAAGAVLLSTVEDFTEHIAEYFALLLLSTIGMMLLVSTEEILMVFVALELTSVPLYVLAAFHKRSAASTEAALKYFLFGGVAAAFTLYGFSLLYGLTGATNLNAIASNLGSKVLAGQHLDSLVIVALIFTVAGFAFKVAAVPFHLWAPDVYQGAPAPAAAFVASGSKVAAFYILAKILQVGFEGVEGSASLTAGRAGYLPFIALLSAGSLVLGNLAAIVQTSVRRLLAYSAVAHAGYMLVGYMAQGPDAIASILYYAITYAVTTLGAFGVVLCVQRSAGNDSLDSFAGLWRRSPVLGFSALVFFLSLGGIPPLAGFFGKFYVFTAALTANSPALPTLWLVLLALAMSAVSLYYYLQVLKQVFVRDAAAGTPPLKTPPAVLGLVLLLAVFTVVFGCLPQLLVDPLLQAVRLAGF